MNYPDAYTGGMDRDGRRKASPGSTAIMPYSAYPEAALVLSDCDRRLVFLHEPHGPWAEQYRRIVSRVASRYPEGGALMVTSPAPEDGKTLTALNMSFCLAERGPVLLVDLDTRHSSVRCRLGLGPTTPGIEDALLENRRPDDCVVSLLGTRLCLISNRGNSHATVELMAAGRPERFLSWALRKFAWVVFDTPPAFPIADTLDIARHVSVGVLVLRSRKTPIRLAKQAIEAFRGHMHFVLLNDAEAPGYAVYNKRYYFEQEDSFRS